MKSIFYLLTILFLSLLLACSEEPPTSVDSETLTKKPIKDPPDPPLPLTLVSGNVHIISGTYESIRNKNRSSFRVWTDYGVTPQIREQDGERIDVAIYDNNGVVELLVYNYSVTGKGRNRVELSEIQIWRHGDIDTPSESYNLGDFLYVNIAIGELDETYDGDEIILAGFNMGGGPEFRIYNPNNGGFNNPNPITFDLNQAGMFATPVAIGDVEGDEANEIIFQCLVRRLAVLDYSSGDVKTYDTNEQLNQIAVGYVDGGLDEIIWGGLSGEIHILEFDGITETFNEKWESVNLGGQIWSLAAGDFYGDSKYEIAVSNLSSGNPSTIYVFDYDVLSPNPPYAINELDEIPEGVIAMFAGNANNDPALKKDLVVGTRTNVKVYDASSGGYTPPFFNVDIGKLVTSVYLK